MKNFNNSAKVNPSDIFGDTIYDQFSVGFGIIDMSAQPTDYRVDSTGVESAFLPKYMRLIPETAGVIIVELVGQDEGTTYTITAAQVTAFTGKPLPYKVRRVIKTGTTATFSVVW